MGKYIYEKLINQRWKELEHRKVLPGFKKEPSDLISQKSFIRKVNKTGRIKFQ